MIIRRWNALTYVLALLAVLVLGLARGTAWASGRSVLIEHTRPHPTGVPLTTDDEGDDGTDDDGTDDDGTDDDGTDDDGTDDDGTDDDGTDDDGTDDDGTDDDGTDDDGTDDDGTDDDGTDDDGTDDDGTDDDGTDDDGTDDDGTDDDGTDDDGTDDDEQTTASIATLALTSASSGASLSTLSAGGTPRGQLVARSFELGGSITRQDVVISVRGLGASRGFDVAFDAVSVGTILTDNHGAGQLQLSTAPLGGALALAPELFPTASTLVSVADGKGRVVLSGDFADARLEERSAAGAGSRLVAPFAITGRRLDQGATAGFLGGRQFLRFKVSGLTPLASYTLSVDGVLLQIATADATGRIAASFTSQPAGGELELPASLQPVTGLVLAEVGDESGKVVRTGLFEPVTVIATSNR